MLLIKLLSLFFKALSLCITLSALLFLIVLLLRLINCVKKLIVWSLCDKIRRVSLFPTEKRYRKEIVETGFSLRPYSFNSSPVYHYKYKNVFVGTYRNIVVEFDNGFKIKINVKEEGLLYTKLIRPNLNIAYPHNHE